MALTHSSVSVSVSLALIPLPRGHMHFCHTLCTAPPIAHGLRDSNRCLLPSTTDPACQGPRNSCQLQLKLPTPPAWPPGCPSSACQGHLCTWLPTREPVTHPSSVPASALPVLPRSPRLPSRLPISPGWQSPVDSEARLGGELGGRCGDGWDLIPELSTYPHPLARPFSATSLPCGHHPPISPSPVVST